MTPVTRLLRTLGAAAVAASLVLAGGSGRPALANGVGDLYVADPQHVEEVWLLHNQIEQAIAVPPSATPTGSAAASGTPAAVAATCTSPAPSTGGPAPTALSFTADGRTLYTANGSASLYTIRISDLCVMGPVAAPAPVSAIGHPKGTSLYVATAGSKTLSTLTDGTSTLADGPEIAGTPDILAADPRDVRVVAAKRGQPWLAIVDPSLASTHMVTYPGGTAGIGGEVAAVAIARDESAVWVAMTGANPRVVRIDLSTGRVLNSAPLAGIPGALTAVDHGAVVSVGKTLYLVQGNKASTWAPQEAPVLQLATDLTAGYVYVATATTLSALDVTDPTATPAASVPMPGAPAALAAVPDRASSLPATGGSVKPAASGNDANAAATAKPSRTHAPSTDTVSGLVDGRSVDPATVLLGVGALVITVAVGSRHLLKRFITD
jgi:hypothetical protein